MCSSGSGYSAPSFTAIFYQPFSFSGRLSRFDARPLNTTLGLYPLNKNTR
jgi:hypothetical protein